MVTKKEIIAILVKTMDEQGMMLKKGLAVTNVANLKVDLGVADGKGKKILPYAGYVGSGVIYNDTILMPPMAGDLEACSKRILENIEGVMKLHAIPQPIAVVFPMIQVHKEIKL